MKGFLMYKLLILLLIIIFASCGNKSQIKTDVAPITTAQAYGDGTLTKIPFILPLSEDSISGFDSPLSKAGFLFGGVARLFLDAGAVLGLGKAELTLDQPVPDLPKDVLKSVKLKRVFFFIEPKDGKREKGYLDRFLFGERSADFNFLDKLVLKLKPTQFDKIVDWYPKVQTKVVNSIFMEKISSAVTNLKDPVHDMTLINYDRTLNSPTKDVSHIALISCENLIHVRDFIQKEFSPLIIKRMQILGKTLVVETNSMSDFKKMVDEYSFSLNELGIKNIEQCSTSICLDFKIESNNLMDLVQKNNGIKINTYFDVGQLPDSFILKGFIEVDTQLKLTF